MRRRVFIQTFNDIANLVIVGDTNNAALHQFQQASIFPCLRPKLARCSRKRRQPTTGGIGVANRATRLLKIISAKWHWILLKNLKRGVLSTWEPVTAALLFPLADFSNSFYQRICLCFIFSLYQHSLMILIIASYEPIWQKINFFVLFRNNFVCA